MRSRAIAFTPIVRSVVLETTRRLLADHRDGVTGEIADKDLARAVMKAIDQEQPEIAKTGRTEAWSVGIYQTVREHIRLSTGRFAVHHREHRAAESEVRARQRRMVTFKDRAGDTVTKDRLKLRKDEIPFVRTAYERRAAGAMDVVLWCDAVWEQMAFLRLGDDALVESVVDCADADEEEAI